MTLNVYDKQGIPISMERYGELSSERGYQRVARTKVMDAADPAKTYDVSTVWLGFDHSFGLSGPPVIFETMVFAEGSSADLDCERYSTETEAREGHTAMVVTLAATLATPVVMDAD